MITADKELPSKHGVGEHYRARTYSQTRGLPVLVARRSKDTNQFKSLSLGGVGESCL